MMQCKAKSENLAHILGYQIWAVTAGRETSSERAIQLKTSYRAGRPAFPWPWAGPVTREAGRQPEHAGLGPTAAQPGGSRRPADHPRPPAWSRPEAGPTGLPGSFFLFL